MEKSHGQHPALPKITVYHIIYFFLEQFCQQREEDWLSNILFLSIHARHFGLFFSAYLTCFLTEPVRQMWNSLLQDCVHAKSLQASKRKPDTIMREKSTEGY